MEIRITEVEPPMFSEFTMFAEIKASELLEKKELTIIAQQHTKTRIHTSVKFGNACCGINWTVAGFRTHEERELNMFSGVVSYPNYFIRSKVQNKEVYLKYIAKLLKVYCEKLQIDVLKVTFIDRYKQWI